MKIFCDVCGDIVVAYIPVEVIFYQRGKIILNICFDCWIRRFQGNNRKLQIAKIMEVLNVSNCKNYGSAKSWPPVNIERWRRRFECEFSRE